MATTTITVRVSGPLADFVAENVGETGLYENVSEYIRDLIRRDKEKAEERTFQEVREELAAGMAASDEEFLPLDEARALVRARTGRA